VSFANAGQNARESGAIYEREAPKKKSPPGAEVELDGAQRTTRSRLGELGADHLRLCNSLPAAQEA
jgi:hypothetical protein